MAEVNNMRKVFLVVLVMVYGILYASVEVDSEHAL
jgi:hypothetical protein